MGIDDVFVPGGKRELPRRASMAVKRRPQHDHRPGYRQRANHVVVHDDERPQSGTSGKVYEPLSQVDFRNFARPPCYFPPSKGSAAICASSRAVSRQLSRAQATKRVYAS